MRLNALFSAGLTVLFAASCGTAFYQKTPVYKSSRVYVYTLPDAKYPEEASLRAHLKPVQPLPEDAADSLLNLFTWLKYEKKGLIGSVTEYVYDPQQLNEVAPILHDVIKAKPAGVRFLLLTQYDRYRTILSKMRRTALLFWSDGESLHLVFGEINTELVGDDFAQDERWIDIYPVSLKRAPSDTKILENPAFTYGKMGDFTHLTWLVVPLSALSEIKPDPDFTKKQETRKPEAGEKNRNVEERLKKLEDLKARGLITDKEYEAQRARILGDI